MAHGNLQTNSFHGNDKDPFTAAMLSLIPGLGQLYNGDRRKGVLFLEATAINIVLVLLLVSSQSLASWLSQLGQAHRVLVNPDLIRSLSQAHFGSPASLLVMAMIAAFVLYAQRDAYDRACGMKRRAIYGNFVIDLSEATSGSYVAHWAIILACFILSLFFIAPRPQIQESVLIEFVEPQVVKTHIPQRTNRISTTSSRDSGRHRPEPVLTSRPQAQARSQSQSPSRSQPAASEQAARTSQTQAHTQQTQPQPLRPVSPSAQTQPQPQARVQSEAQAQTQAQATSPAQPMPMPIRISRPANSAPLPVPRPIATGDDTPARTSMPLPVHNNLLAANPTLPGPLPNFLSRPAGAAQMLPAGPSQLNRLSGSGSHLPVPNARPGIPTGTTGLPGSTTPAAIGPLSSGTVPTLPGAPRGSTIGSIPTGAPGPAQIASLTPPGSGTAPQAPASSRRGGPASDSSGGPSGPAPVSSGGPDGRRAGAPTIGMPAPVVDPGTGANPAKTTGGTTPSTAARKEPIFDQYMANLQRRIKKYWFPSRSQSHMVTVQFTISTYGEMSNLHLVSSSGVAINDRAALSAVENAAPFAHLPENAPDNVDIEFHFDMNVFGSQGGAVRRFD